MTGVLTILSMSALLGATSFGIGMLPLFFTFSRARIAYLSTVGTGLLLGVALGIIIPEGIETLVSSSRSSEPVKKIALSLLCGFSFMLLIEQSSSGHAQAHKHQGSPLPVPPQSLHPFHDISPDPGAPSLLPRVEELDLALTELEGAEGSGSGIGHPTGRAEQQAKAERARESAFPLTLGLVIHSLADGLALGASALPGEGEGHDAGSSIQLSFLVFLALIVHKAPTALALSMSLLSKTLPPSECRKHLAIFSASTPLGALASFGILSLLGAGAGGDWTGTALLVSGGSFLYVATVLQPLSHQEGLSPSSSEMSEKIRVGLIVLGMFLPFLISLAFGHEHVL